MRDDCGEGEGVWEDKGKGCTRRLHWVEVQGRQHGWRGSSELSGSAVGGVRWLSVL